MTEIRMPAWALVALVVVALLLAPRWLLDGLGEMYADDGAEDANVGFWP